jgi:hypothetical protein
VQWDSAIRVSDGMPSACVVAGGAVKNSFLSNAPQVGLHQAGLHGLPNYDHAAVRIESREQYREISLVIT